MAITRALVKEPKVVLADEPTANLDEVTSLKIIRLMQHLWKERGMTLVLVPHDTKVARPAPRTAVITKGKLTMRDNRAPNVTPQAPQGRPSRPAGLPDRYQRRSQPSHRADRPQAGKARENVRREKHPER